MVPFWTGLANVAERSPRAQALYARAGSPSSVSTRRACSMRLPWPTWTRASCTWARMQPLYRFLVWLASWSWPVVWPAPVHAA
eukprot:10537508-Lingulodinium_polyedra.AAC.1